MTDAFGQYVQSCALAIYYTDDWGDGCKFTYKDVDDYATAILEKCAKGNTDKIGGHAKITMNNCTGQVEIIHTSGSPPLPTSTSDQGPSLTWATPIGPHSMVTDTFGLSTYQTVK